VAWPGPVRGRQPRSADTASPGTGRPEPLCDHEGVPRGTASRWKRRYAVRLTVPRRGGWRAWGTVRADFEGALADPADPADPAIVAAQVAPGRGLRPGDRCAHRPDRRRSRRAHHARDAFCTAARDDLTGWELAAAAAQVQPEPPLSRAGLALSSVRGRPAPAGRNRARHEIAFPLHPGAQGEHFARSWSAMAVLSWVSVLAILTGPRRTRPA
jgi:hypothetical protein